MLGYMLATVIHFRLHGREKKDWNAIVRSNTMHSNPIGTKRSSLVRRQQRSIRRQLIDDADLGLDMDTAKVVGEYNFHSLVVVFFTGKILRIQS